MCGEKAKNRSSSFASLVVSSVWSRGANSMAETYSRERPRWGERRERKKKCTWSLGSWSGWTGRTVVDCGRSQFLRRRLLFRCAHQRAPAPRIMPQLPAPQCTPLDVLRLQAMDSPPRGLLLVIGCVGVLLGLCDVLPGWDGCKSILKGQRAASTQQGPARRLRVQGGDNGIDHN